MNNIYFGRACYFVIFKDECISFQLLYFFKSKLKVLDKLKTLHHFVLKDTKNNIKNLPDDRVSDLMSVKFKNTLRRPTSSTRWQFHTF